MIVREHAHAFQRKPPPLSGAGIERRHRTTFPAENCFELGNGCPSVGCACRIIVAASKVFAALHELARDKVRRIAANIAKLPGLAR